MEREDRILLVEDDEATSKVVSRVLEAAGFVAERAATGAAALSRLVTAPPVLVLLDWNLPDLSGIDLCKHMRAHPLWRAIPVIMLTGRREADDCVRGLDAGANDFVVKPFSNQELIARIRTVLARTAEALDTNPLTHLPGNAAIKRELAGRLQAGKPVALGYVDVDNFKVYNDLYGFAAGDQVIEATARIVREAVSEEGGEFAFVGHVGGDDFVFIVDPERADAVGERITLDFDALAGSFYSSKDFERGYIRTRDRKGELRDMPLMTVSVAVATNLDLEYEHPAELAQAAGEVKALAKSVEGSSYVKDRRKKTWRVRREDSTVVDRG